MKNIIYKVQTISELHEIAGFEKPKHPLVTVIDYSKVKVKKAPESGSFICSFYSVNFKKHCSFLYGKQTFDHKEGTLHCTGPEQIITFDRKKEEGSTEGWGLYFHPELIRNSALGKKINEFSFFSYTENEALHLSDQEKQILLSILKQMENEYNTNIDHYSHNLIISNIELLLNYCNRFYGRQFITRSNQNKDVIVRFEELLTDYFNSQKLKNNGIPTVKYCAEAMNLSANYFSDLLRSETGKNAQEHIHYHLLEKAKSILLNSDKNINEIANELGYEYPQNFSKLFKKKIGVSPTDYRNLTFKN
ncbi:MAG: AraC family transcriptional regulator [Bacteroidetes bacterium]|nr:AraC family transcriptional regulator [Bacteroidota bacterium]